MKKSLLVLSALLINNLSAATLTTNKPSYTTTDTIKINFNEMTNHHKDWIAIYPANSSTEWKNVVKWAWTQNKSEGTLTFKNLPAGQYEARAFYNNSYDIEAKHAFQVTGNQAKAELSATKAIFKADEDVLINFKNINGATNDWLAIYPANKNNDWENVVKWKFNKGGVKAGQANFDKLPFGRYEARIFYNNTFKMEGKVAFEVRESWHPNNDFIESFYTKDHKYSFNYRNSEPKYPDDIPEAEWVVIKDRTITDRGSLGRTIHHNPYFQKVKGLDIFIIGVRSPEPIIHYYKINNQGKLTKLPLHSPVSGGGHIEPLREEVINENGKSILKTRYRVYNDSKIHSYAHDVTDLNHVIFLSENIEGKF